MRAMILAAGRGERLRPLTDTTPKPLLKVGGKALVEWQIDRLAAAGISEIVINHAWLGEQFLKALGDGSRWGVTIRYSAEHEALETIGGIVKARSLLGNQPFIVTSGDVYSDYDYQKLIGIGRTIGTAFPNHVAHFVLADNPSFNLAGDMALVAGKAALTGEKLNYAGIAVYHPRLFDEFAEARRQKLFPWAFQFVNEGRVSAEHHRGVWVNVGTVEQLQELDARLQSEVILGAA
jgi:N-acetyl-alpha-D-muramate 1-phosphate uridylyltransferase